MTGLAPDLKLFATSKFCLPDMYDIINVCLFVGIKWVMQSIYTREESFGNV